MMGKINPIKGFVVHPKIVIASPIPGMATARPYQIVHITMVTMMFCFMFIPFSG